MKKIFYVMALLHYYGLLAVSEYPVIVMAHTLRDYNIMYSPEDPSSTKAVVRLFLKDDISTKGRITKKHTNQVVVGNSEERKKYLQENLFFLGIYNDDNNIQHTLYATDGKEGYEAMAAKQYCK